MQGHALAPQAQQLGLADVQCPIGFGVERRPRRRELLKHTGIRAKRSRRQVEIELADLSDELHPAKERGPDQQNGIGGKVFHHHVLEDARHDL
ncbi:hypothetical protein G6F32_016065 [Rhizopus arrhizus]|nr:hypothetical protein G6F32_016065 [Rhizopus arrhizus]